MHVDWSAGTQDAAHYFPPARLPHPTLQGIEFGHATRFWTVDVRTVVLIHNPTLYTVFYLIFLFIG